MSVFLPYLSGMKIALFLAIFCHPWSVWLHHIFPHHLINGKVFGSKLMNNKRVLIFPTNFVSKISHYEKHSER